ncbi:O-antigen ligase family protein [Piscinibacter sp. HJYY11]|uniref:O-antigen ligase family protein n=1 Tax=Piscinibacter sp. HJYY11 TaxID=2801333 RepID=UPI00191D014B|nr:O-antigen ligase family protein [Piscinibacter sp. HJYY11]MBL0727924.1 hypothetical protein [Piscinibacter sp. HJYY11]
MNRKLISDWLFVASVAAGLFQSLALAGLVLALLVRGNFGSMKWRTAHTFLALAAAWAMGVVALRGGDTNGMLPYFSYLWFLPLLLAWYKPSDDTLRAFSWLIVGLFFADLLFNVYSSAVGRDLFGRIVDAREGVVGGRNGGLFAHSFYSGAISITAAITLLASRTGRWVAALALVNLMLAGSWRLAVAIPIIFMFTLRWRTRSRRMELALVLLLSVLIVLGVIATSGFVDNELEVNDSNKFRVYAWLLALAKVATSPLIGVGFPSIGLIEGISFSSIDENLVTESWYLGAAATFGIPYVVLFLGAFLTGFYGPDYGQRDLRRAIVFPFVIIDLTYGEFFGAVLVYTWLWLLICAPWRVAPPLRRPRRHRPIVRVEANGGPAGFSPPFAPPGSVLGARC